MIVKLNRVERGITFGAIDPKSGKIAVKYEECADKFVPSMDIKTGALRTGLTPEDEVKFEDKLTLPEGTLKSTSKYWDKFVIMIPTEGLEINTDNPLGELRYKVLKADPFIATSKAEEERLAKAEYVMTSDEEVATNANAKRDIIIKAYSELGELSRIGVEDVLFMFNVNASDTSPETNRNRLGELVDKSPAKFIEKVSDPELKNKVFILRCIKKGIIDKVGRSIGTDVPMKFGTIDLGTGLEQVIVFLKDKANQNVYTALKKAYKAA